MNIFKISKIVIASILLTASLTACSGSNDGKDENKDLKEVAEEQNDAKFKKEGDPEIDKVSEADAQFLVDAYSAGLYEVMMADTAMVYATSKEAKDLAKMLSVAHTGANEKMRGIAVQKQISLPNDISAEQITEIAKTRDKKRMAFDKDYASAMIDKHKDAIALYEKCANDCTDIDLKTFFTGTLPELRSHLDMAIASEAKIKAMK